MEGREREIWEGEMGGRDGREGEGGRERERGREMEGVSRILVVSSE